MIDSMSRWLLWIHLACAIAFAQQPTVEGERAAKPGGEARAALALAEKTTNGELEGLEGEERRAALQRGAERWAALAERFAADKAAVARAWFECGELWRRHGSLDTAQAAYEKSVASEDAGYRERALFGKAEMQRRRKLFDEAIESYGLASRVTPESNRAHSARLWIARCLESKGDRTAAIEQLRRCLEADVRPLQIVETCDELAKTLVDAGDLTGAAGAIEHAERVCRDHVAKGEPNADGLQRAVERMTARRALQRARDKADGASKDAIRFEGERDGGR